MADRTGAAARLPRSASFTLADGRPDRKRPLFRALPPAPDFPMHALGALRPAAEAVQDHTQAPRSRVRPIRAGRRHAGLAGAP